MDDFRTSYEAFADENRYNAKCRAAIDTLKLFVEDAEQQLHTNMPLSTIKLILKGVDGNV